MTDTGISAQRLESIIKRIEELENINKQTLKKIGRIYAKAEANGFNVYAIYHLVRFRRTKKKRMDKKILLALYKTLNREHPHEENWRKRMGVKPIDWYKSAIGME